MNELRSFRRTPMAALAPFVASLLYFEGEFPHGRERALPSGTTQLLVNLDADRLTTYAEDGLTPLDETGGTAFAGARTSHIVLDPHEQRAILSVSFRHGGAFPFFSAPASGTVDQLVGLDLLWGSGGSLLRERLLESPTPEDKLRVLEAELLAHVVRPLVREPALAYAVAALDRGVSVSAITERLGFTSKRFVRFFTEQIGLTPKRFARVRRLQRTLSSIPPEPSADWAELAVQCGYYDQAHLIHDFRELAGITPTQYHPRAPGEHNHVPL